MQLSVEVLGFWRAHGAEWAQENAGTIEVERVVGIVERAVAAARPAAAVAAALRAIWETGFSWDEPPFGWNEMGDDLPPEALLAFGQGVREGVSRSWPDPTA